MGFAVVIGAERLTRVFATGAVLAVAGALLVSSPGTSAFALGDLLFLAATVPLGLAVVVARRIAPSTPSSEITRYQTGFANGDRRALRRCRVAADRWPDDTPCRLRRRPQRSTLGSSDWR